VSTTQRAGRAAATCTATPVPRLAPWSAMRAASTSAARGPVEELERVGHHRRLAGLPALAP
jgi:hypothetical protein